MSVKIDKSEVFSPASLSGRMASKRYKAAKHHFRAKYDSALVIHRTTKRRFKSILKQGSLNGWVYSD